MLKKLYSLIFFALVVNSNLLATDFENLDKVKDSVISGHLDYSKIAIERKCQKINKKIQRLEQKQRSASETDSDKEELLKTASKIEKLKNRLDALEKMKMSMDIIDFKAL